MLITALTILASSSSSEVAHERPMDFQSVYREALHIAQT
jgi:hypothetical protein